MVKRKSFGLGSLAGFVTFFFVSPLDDFLYAFIFSKTVFQLGWLESVLLGVIIGTIVLGVTEILTGES